MSFCPDNNYKHKCYPCLVYADFRMSICHSMYIFKILIDRINMGRIPIIAFDHPLYALPKQIHCKRPITYGEGQLVILFGGLHTEIAVHCFVAHIKVSRLFLHILPL